MRTIWFFLLILLSYALFAQETFVKSYDFFDGVDESVRNMFIIGEEVHILGRGDCDETRCLHYYVLDINGEVLRTQRYPDIWPTLFGSQRDSSIYLGGFLRTDTIDDGYRIFELNLDGDMMGTAKYDQYALADPPGYDLDTYFPRGAIANDEKIVVYGDTRETDAINDNFRRGLLMYYNKDLSFDTLVFINPRYRDTEMWRAELDSKEDFVFLFDYDENETNEDYRTVARYDSEGHLLFRWEPPELYFENHLFIPLLVTHEDKYLTHIEGDTLILDEEDFIFITENGDNIWRRAVDFASVSIGTLAFSETADKQILMAGFSHHPHFDGAHISKYDSDTGDVIWDRVYVDWGDALYRNTKPTFYCVEELSDGSLLVAGTRERWMRDDSLAILRHNDLYLMRLDSEGCLEPGCGGLEQHIAGVPEYFKLTNVFSFWEYQDTDAPHGMVRENYSGFSAQASSDKEVRYEFDLNFIESFIEQTKVFRYEDDGRKIYYQADWLNEPEKEVLLYDFTLEVGDVFESDYIDQPLVVIESDTMRLSNQSKMRYWVLACTENPEQTITWMEKIGTYYDLVWPPDFCSGDYGPSRLTCYYWHSRLAHMNPDFEECLSPITSTDELAFIALSNITAYPNPTTGRISITTPGDLLIERTELMDTKGVSHTRFHNKTTEVYYDLSDYPSGLYFVSVYTEKGSAVKKIVVE